MNKKARGLSLDYTTACGHVTWHVISGLRVPEAPGKLQEQEHTEFLSLVAICSSWDLSLQSALWQGETRKIQEYVRISAALT